MFTCVGKCWQSFEASLIFDYSITKGIVIYIKNKVIRREALEELCMPLTVCKASFTVLHRTDKTCVN